MVSLTKCIENFQEETSDEFRALLRPHVILHFDGIRVDVDWQIIVCADVDEVEFCL
jgi:hypothetical protein